MYLAEFILVDGRNNFHIVNFEPIGIFPSQQTISLYGIFSGDRSK